MCQVLTFSRQVSLREKAGNRKGLPLQEGGESDKEKYLQKCNFCNFFIFTVSKLTCYSVLY